MVSTLAVVIGLVAVASYATGTLLQVLNYRKNTRGSSGVLLLAATVGAVLHGIANYLVIYSGGKLYLGIQTSASLVSWIMLAFLLIANLRLPLSNLLILVLPVGILGVLCLITAPPDEGLHLATLSDPLIWHIFISILAYSILFMAACQSVLLAVVEHRLKHRRTRLIQLLPPLQTMETLLFDLLWVGIVVLTLAVGSGFLFLDDMFEQRVVHHTVLTLASWVLYAVLLIGHHGFGWRGTTAVRWSLIAFSLLVLGYFGSKFVIEILLES